MTLGINFLSNCSGHTSSAAETQSNGIALKEHNKKVSKAEINDFIAKLTAVAKP